MNNPYPADSCSEKASTIATAFSVGVSDRNDLAGARIYPPPLLISFRNLWISARNAAGVPKGIILWLPRPPQKVILSPSYLTL
jgi:hypothetical protein